MWWMSVLQSDFSQSRLHRHLNTSSKHPLLSEDTKNHVNLCQNIQLYSEGCDGKLMTTIMMVKGSGPDGKIHTEYKWFCQCYNGDCVWNSCEHCGSDSLQQLVVSEAERFLQQDGQHHAEDEEAFLLRRAVLITDLNRDEPHQRGQQQRHQPEKRSERKNKKTNMHN